MQFEKSMSEQRNTSHEETILGFENLLASAKKHLKKATDPKEIASFKEIIASHKKTIKQLKENVRESVAHIQPGEAVKFQETGEAAHVIDYFNTYPTAETKRDFVATLLNKYITGELNRKDLQQIENRIIEEWMNLFNAVQEEAGSKNPLPDWEEMQHGIKGTGKIEEALDVLFGKRIGWMVAARLSYFVVIAKEMRSLNQMIDQYEERMARQRAAGLAKSA